MRECDCGAATEGKWADIHHPKCLALLSPAENEHIESALDRMPDWPPQSSAVGLRDGERRHGSTGQLFEVHDGRWERVRRS